MVLLIISGLGFIASFIIGWLIWQNIFKDFRLRADFSGIPKRFTKLNLFIYYCLIFLISTIGVSIILLKL